ncbi:sulfur oxidation c-type cytochrome SoxA [Methylobacterium nodulans]|uniref:SoxAX cytochrome complex subunit A n=1 Tax=Methylobacterium nodulans (strain LMG 21967 / CNCM I-2342 / ORS 2060) TaxID=460265 RepID=B8IQV6_METNO|nr:sulfur oxidation c-type cytochrome SoxA [Methylobacterium nodulans]ACL62401.1 putative diheme cytochrome c; sulfur oxidizing protein SoxA [Methylobacterium nodulans ORS 2060]
MSSRRGLALALLAICCAPLAAEEIPPAARRSGFDQMTPELRAMQQDDAANPGVLWAADGLDAWAAPASSGRPSCAGCHGDITAMRGVAARYPAWDETEGRPVDLAGRIDLCRIRHQGEAPLPRESRPLLALTAAVAMQSRGMPVAPPADPRLDAARAEGRALFTRRMGQLDLSCAGCHDAHWGRHLGAGIIPQGHPNGYPLYRLEWQDLGSFQRRLRNCLVGMRAEPYPAGAPEAVALELYLMQRAAGLPVEAPAVRP